MMLSRRNPQLNSHGELIHLLSIEGLPQAVVTQILDTAGSFLSAGMFLALPTAIKLYPVMMLAIPISLARSARVGVRTLIGSMLRIVLFSALVPALVYGFRAWDSLARSGITSFSVR